MKYKYLIIILATSFILNACNNNNHSTNKTETLTINSEKETKTQVALDFINAYVANANKMSNAVGLLDWVNASELVSNDLKSALKKIVDDADPEMGLEFDPILDAQDFPTEGFKLESINEETNYISVSGIDMPSFKLTIKVEAIKEKYLVDGCGIVNIPMDKRADR